VDRQGAPGFEIMTPGIQVGWFGVGWSASKDEGVPN
jgi:hypothetical protein